MFAWGQRCRSVAARFRRLDANAGMMCASSQVCATVRLRANQQHNMR